MKLDKEVADFIIYLIISYNEIESSSIYLLSDYSIKGSAKYLLRQLIRQINIPHTNMYVSEKALAQWNKITNDNIKEKCYNSRVTCKIDWLDRPKYIGASKTSQTEKTYQGESFKYNEVFLDEHVVPVEIIIRELLKLDTTSKNIYNQIDLILQNLTVCKILKDENPQNKFNRSLYLEDVLKTDYSQIKMYNFNQIDESGKIIEKEDRKTIKILKI